jgi:hypothetical protein
MSVPYKSPESCHLKPNRGQAKTFNPNYSGGRDWRIEAQANLVKKFMRPQSQPVAEYSGVWLLPQLHGEA